ncbi:sensor histidine kinase [Polycyclovorans algicola]|uniref:sensor histidine kinase n=1 Tax=Polycyclovorans algicola TaxID=616992 RepID=UPI0004A72CE1|nr:sensor histidine kinase [Polycyclovorans algicola]
MNPGVATRLTLVAGLTLVLLLPLASALLSKAFREPVTHAFDERLHALVETLAGQIEVDADGQLVRRRDFPDPLFARIYSGWYWQIMQGDRVAETSRSLWDTRLNLPTLNDGARHLRTLTGPRDEAVRTAILRMSLPDQDVPVLILVAGPQAHIDAEVKIVVRRLGMTLGALGVILFVVFVVQIRWGLAPLRRMTDDLQAVRAGERPRLDTRLPRDLAQLAGAMNEVLDHQVALIGRGRATAGNLAHALKQPLASLRMQLARHEPDLDALRQALKQIEPTIDHHLTRAAVAGQAGGHYQKVMAAGVIAPLVEGIRRMYGGQGKVIRATVPETLQVSIDPQDLQELVGNLLENAAKWAESIATLSWVATPDGWALIVEDDGPGLPVEARDGVLARGARLDEKRPGSGLGLAIVNDLVTLYQLSIALDDSPLGGLRVVVASKAGTP